MTFLLDTDTVSFALRGVGQVAEQLRAHRPSEVAISAITVAELRYGAFRRGSRKLHRRLDVLLDNLRALPFDADAANRYGRLAATLAKRGAAISMADAMIAAHALNHDLTLVTHNVRHFERVDGLIVVDWVPHRASRDAP